MSFFKKVGKLAKKGVKLYAAYQTGGLSNVALSALSKKKAVKSAGLPMLLQQSSASFGGGLTATPAAFVGGGGGGFADKKVRKPRLTKDGRVTMRRRHTINPANVKALRRSIRRLKGAEKLFRTVLTVQGKAHAGIKPKTGRKR